MNRSFYRRSLTPVILAVALLAFAAPTAGASITNGLANVPDDGYANTCHFTTAFNTANPGNGIAIDGFADGNPSGCTWQWAFACQSGGTKVWSSWYGQAYHNTPNYPVLPAPNTSIYQPGNSPNVVITDNGYNQWHYVGGCSVGWTIVDVRIRQLYGFGQLNWQSDAYGGYGGVWFWT